MGETTTTGLDYSGLDDGLDDCSFRSFHYGRGLGRFDDGGLFSDDFWLGSVGGHVLTVQPETQRTVDDELNQWDDRETRERETDLFSTFSTIKLTERADLQNGKNSACCSLQPPTPSVQFTQ